MLGKLLKYDLRFGADIFIGLYVALLLLGLLSPWLGDILLGINGIIVLSAITVTCIVLNILTYYESMFASQGYLTHALPVKAAVLVGSKIIAAMLWFNMAFISVSLSMVLLTRKSELSANVFGDSFHYTPWNVFFCVITINFGVMAFILAVYLAMSISSVSVKGRHLGFIGYIATAVMSVSMLNIGELMPFLFEHRLLIINTESIRFFTADQFMDATKDAVFLADGTFSIRGVWDWPIAAIFLAVSAICYFGTVWIIKRKSNLK